MTAARIEDEQFKKKVHSMKRALSCIAVSATALLATCNTGLAQVDPFVGQIMVFSGSFCPQHWLPANGQLLSIYSNQALYSLLGNTYGGQYPNTFALPNAASFTTLTPGASLLVCISTSGVYPSRP
jgi:NADH:ubiquinone oxidoreductase subunit 4 (subunit M)